MGNTLNIHQYINFGDRLKITRPDGTVIFLTISGIGTLTNGFTDTFTIDTNLHNSDFIVDWHNCYSFGNGVESNRIRDGYNKSFVTNGVRVSTIFEDYKEEHKKYGLIYSGLYNDTSGTNNLNQFVQAEKITKDINPIYGSIQKLHSRDTDLVTICEDKALKILANKDAVYNADGNVNLTATENVLGQVIPFVGEYGISKNPESFASENYRSYFVDKQRGAVLRLSKDGLTPISDHGMRDWFRDNLRNTGKIIGSYDDFKDEYNLTITKLGLNLLSNSEFNTGGTIGTILSGIGNEVTNSAIDNYVPGTTTTTTVLGPELFLDGNVDDGDGVAAGQLDLLVVDGEVTNAVDFAVDDMQPLHYYLQNGIICKIAKINGIAQTLDYVIVTVAGQTYIGGGVTHTLSQNDINIMLGYWQPNQAGGAGLCVDAPYETSITLNDDDVLTLAPINP